MDTEDEKEDVFKNEGVEKDMKYIFRKWSKNTQGKYRMKSVEDLNEIKDPKLKVMMWTGLRDKNNRRIYEGDIIKWEWGSERGIEEVRWTRWMEEMSEGSGFQFPWFCVSDKECEVIGNIYENKEILKEKNSPLAKAGRP